MKDTVSPIVYQNLHEMLLPSSLIHLLFLFFQIFLHISPLYKYSNGTIYLVPFPATARRRKTI
jgi:hypothetical protein